MSKEKLQNELENILLNTYLSNLNFLKNEDTLLFERIQNLSILLENKIYEENYLLEYIEEDKEFDIYNKQDDIYLYDKKPSSYNKKTLHNGDSTKKQTFSLLNESLIEKTAYDVFSEVEYMCNFDYANKILANEINDYIKNLKIDEKSDYKYIEKIIFVGTLLGKHIPLFINKFKSKTIFICEENLEIFRLSLFTTNYAILFESGVTFHFSIMNDSNDLLLKFENFLTEKLYENYNIKYFSTEYRVENSFEIIINNILIRRSKGFNHHFLLDNTWNLSSSRINNYNVLQILNKSNNSYLEKPVLILGAGPSLEENISWLKKNQSKFIIVCFAASYKLLESLNIEADIVTTMDPQYAVLKKKQFTKDILIKLQNKIILASMDTDQRILDSFNFDKLFLYEVYQPMHSKNRCYKGFSIGELTLSIITQLGFKEIYLIGLDFALNQKTGSSHYSGYSSNIYNLEKKEENEANLEEEIIKVRGNFQKEVFTTRKFALSIDSLNFNLNIAKSDNQKIFNLSSHGAYIENTISCDIQSLNINVYENLNKQSLVDFFSDFSIKKLSLNDLNDLKIEQKYLIDLKNSILELSKNLSENFEEFKVRITNIINAFLFPNVYCSFLGIVFRPFFETFTQVIMLNFNNKKKREKRKDLRKIELYFYKDLLKTLDKYLFYLKRVLR